MLALTHSATLYWGTFIHWTLDWTGSMHHPFIGVQSVPGVNHNAYSASAVHEIIITNNITCYITNTLKPAYSLYLMNFNLLILWI